MTNEPKVPEYQYRCEDRSVLLPYVDRWILEPMKAWIPLSIHPNRITFAAFVSSLLCLFVISAFPSEVSGPGTLSAVLLLVYLILDNFDGRQAKRTGKSSAVGEFFDHGLDAFSSAALMLAIFIRLGWTGKEEFLWIAAGTYVVSLSIFSYQKTTGELFFGKFSPFETGFVSAVLLMLTDWPVFRNFVHGMSNLQESLVIFTVLLFMLKDALVYLIKTGQMTGPFITSLGLLFCLALFPATEHSLWHVLLICFYGICGVLQVLLAHLTRKSEKFPPVLLAIVPWGAKLVFPVYAELAVQAFACGMALYAGGLFLSGVYRIKQLYRVSQIW